jgi:GNAT superfamily N-acetyltransferase
MKTRTVSPQCRLSPFVPEGGVFEFLLSASLREDFRMLLRLQENWNSGKNRFSRTGEKLLGAFARDRLVGVCGRNIDPYFSGSRLGRVRHLCVDREYRRLGAGTMLVNAIIEGAEQFFEALNVRAPESAFPFYDSLGFERIEGDSVTHRLSLVRASKTTNTL